MSSVFTHRGQDETGQQGPDGDLSGLLEQEQAFHRMHSRWNSRAKTEQDVDIQERDVQHGLLPISRYICRHRHDSR